MSPCIVVMRPHNDSLDSGVSRGSSTPVYQFGHPNHVPKLMKNSLEKISLTQISGDKIFIAIVPKHCKKFNFTISLFFFKKAITTIFMLYFN